MERNSPLGISCSSGSVVFAVASVVSYGNRVGTLIILIRSPKFRREKATCFDEVFFRDSGRCKSTVPIARGKSGGYGGTIGTAAVRQF